MKNSVLIIAVICISAFAKAQTTKVLDTIYANDTKNVALFFPEPIRQGVTGSDNFVFTYNREKEQYFGLLQATPGKESNLLIINRNGAIFSYIIRYRKQLSKLNYFVSQSSSIGNEKPIIIDTTEVTEVENLVDNSRFYYTKFSSYLLERKQRIGTIQKRNESIVLSVENIVFDKEELYFVIQIENKSSLDYDLNFLNLSLETRQKGKRKSLQKLLQEPIFKHNVPSRIAEGEVVKLVYVMPKFSIINDRRLVVELNEKNGERDLKLKVSHKYINNPN
ncbi:MULTISPECIES: DUF4138 domain-containing protein [Maribacter]|uniref:Bacteroides conjugative transposon TraN protein n=1 Tax=Maribacter aquivivus TaxID=228958 RepID=A0A1M6IMF3_9FLAO|nr:MULTISPECIES: DUF4138 domain-containing protein [Maribacter]MDF4220893.1 DUF4138 domain-containing protein [Maribacter huludaoensis]SHJ35706.1 protein of unknown function [Maribacter aquivivus]